MRQQTFRDELKMQTTFRPLIQRRTDGRVPPIATRGRYLAIVCATLFIVSTYVPSLLMAQAPEVVRPCPTVRRSLVLVRDCVGPLRVLSSGVTVDLGGRTVAANEGSRAVEILDRTGVTIVNGVVVGRGGGVYIRGGGDHTVRNVSITAEEDGQSLSIVRSARNRVADVRIAVESNARGVRITGSDNTLASSTLTNTTDSDGPLLFLGSNNTAIGNSFVGVSGSTSVIVRNRARFERNVVTYEPSVINGEQRLLSAIDVTGQQAVVRYNSIATRVLSDASFVGILVSNRFNQILDNGIIADIPNPTERSFSFGIRVEEDQNRNTIERNRIYGATSGISVLGNRNRVADNISPSISIEGRSNSITRNIADILTDANPSCDENNWRRNLFSEDSEGDGPFAGCIR